MGWYRGGATSNLTGECHERFEESEKGCAIGGYHVEKAGNGRRVEQKVIKIKGRVKVAA